MERRTFLAGTGAVLLAVPLAAEGQSTRNMPVVGVLRAGAPDQTVPSIDAFRQGLQGLGYVEGENIALEYRFGGDKTDTLTRLALDLVRLRVDVLYALGPQAIRAARSATLTIPIVGVDLESDPVARGFIASFGRPGGNITGLFLDQPGLASKWLELVREAAPATHHVAILWDSTTGSDQLRALKATAQAATIELQVLEFRNPAEYADLLKTAMKGRPQALIQLSSPVFTTDVSKRVAEFTVRNRLPAISMFRRFAEDGGLMAYGPLRPPFYRRAATYVDKILKGAKPADLPVEQPSKFELVINLKTAKALGLTIPPSLLGRADEVIQ